VSLREAGWEKLKLPTWIRFRLGKWQLVVVFFALAYAFLVTLNLGYIPLQWDEVNHFNGAILLVRGQIWQYAAINSFYPPLYNLVTAAYFALAGASVLTGRLVTVTFSVLSIFIVYKIAREMYGEKTAVVSAVLFGAMPGIVWLSGLALIEMMLLFVFCVSMLFFFRWLQTDRKRDLTLSLISLAVGMVVKYQIIVVAPIIMIVSMLIFGKTKNLKTQTLEFIHSKRLWLGILLFALAAILLFAFYASGLLSVWLYAIQVGNAGQSWYSNRFSTPIFYLLEMVVPYNDKHPISLLLYGLGLAGLTFFAYRRKPQDKFLLVWFIVIYVVFTLIPNRQWRYVTPLFPVLAISAIALAASSIDYAQKTWQSAKSSLTKKRIAKLSAVLLIIFTATGIFYSSLDAYTWAAQGQPQIPIAHATAYVSSATQANQSVLVLCAHNFFNRDMVWFYLNSKSASQTQVYQYPALAADAYSPEFNIGKLVNFCQTNGTGYIMLYEYGGTIQYFDSNLTEQAVYGMLNSTGRFTQQATFGTAPQRIFVMSFK
jgi:4-amino-4-deoxy-L-arabinose transferase-like glycosyltransferase